MASWFTTVTVVVVTAVMVTVVSSETHDIIAPLHHIQALAQMRSRRGVGDEVYPAGEHTGTPQGGPGTKPSGTDEIPRTDFIGTPQGRLETYQCKTEKVRRSPSAKSRGIREANQGMSYRPTTPVLNANQARPASIPGMINPRYPDYTGAQRPGGYVPGEEAKRLSQGNPPPPHAPRQLDASGRPRPQEKQKEVKKPPKVPVIWNNIFPQNIWDSMDAEEIWKTVRCDSEWETVCPVAIWKSLIQDPGLESVPPSVISRFILVDPFLNISSNPGLRLVFSNLADEADKEGELTSTQNSAFPHFFRPFPPFGPRPLIGAPPTITHYTYQSDSGPPPDLFGPTGLLKKVLGEVSDLHSKASSNPNQYGTSHKTYYASSKYGNTENERGSMGGRNEAAAERPYGR